MALFDGIQSYWKFDEISGTTVYDSVGAVDGTCTKTQFVSGKINNAIKFTGTTSTVNFGDNLDFEYTDTFSFSGWYKLGTTGDREGLFFEKGALGGYKWSFDDTEIRVTLRSTTAGVFLYKAWTIADDTNWHNAVFTYDGSGALSGMKMYVDGVLASEVWSSGSISGTMLNSSDLIMKAQNKSATGQTTTVDEFGIWDRVLTSGETVQLYNSGNGITYYPPLYAGIIASAQTICNGSTPSQLTTTVSPTGGTGSYSYRWYSGTTSGATSLCAASATGTTFQPPSLTTDTWYRKRVISGTQTGYTNTIKITVRAALSAGTIGTAQTICNGSTPSGLTTTASPSGGAGSYTYLWYSGTTSGATSAMIGTTGTTYQPPALTQDTWYRKRVIDTCGTGYTASIKITVNAIPAAPTINSILTFCWEDVKTMFTSDTIGTVRWYTDSGLTTCVHTGDTYNPNKGVAGTWYYYVTQTVNNCESDYSPVTYIIYNHVGNNYILSPQTIISGTQPAELTGSTPTGGSGTWAYIWQYCTDDVNWISLTVWQSGTSKNYQPPVLTASTYYRRITGVYPTVFKCGDESDSILITVGSNPTPTVTHDFAFLPDTSNFVWNLPNPSYGTGVRVDYRVSGATNWIEFDTYSTGTTSAFLTGLTPNTTYELRVVVLGSEYPSPTYTFTTPPLPTYGKLYEFSYGASFSQVGSGNTYTDVSSLQTAGGQLIKTDNSLWTWGLFTLNGLGYTGSTGDRTTPVLLSSDVWSLLSDNRNGVWNNHAIKSDGTLWGWGENSRYNLGDGTTTHRYAPVQIGAGKIWKAISNGSFYYSMGITTDGKLWSWGQNANYQTGLNTAVGYTTTITQVGTGTTWESISLGYGIGAGIKSDGTLWTWGDNTSGLTAQGTTVGYTTVPTQVGSDTDWKQVHVTGIYNGVLCAYAVKTNGNVYGWGANQNYQLGLNQNTTKYYTSPVQITGIANVSKIAAGYGCCAALKSDGTLWSWGWGDSGSAGQHVQGQNEAITQYPKQVQSGYTFIDISYGYYLQAIVEEAQVYYPPKFCDNVNYTVSGSTCGNSDGKISIINAFGYIAYSTIYDFTLTDVWGNSYSIDANDEFTGLESNYYFLSASVKPAYWSIYGRDECQFDWIKIEDSDNPAYLSRVVVTPLQCQPFDIQYGRIYYEVSGLTSGNTYSFYAFTSDYTLYYSKTGITNTHDFILNNAKAQCYWIMIDDEVNGCTLLLDNRCVDSIPLFSLSGIKKLWIAKWSDDLDYNYWSTKDDDYFLDFADTSFFTSTKIKEYLSITGGTTGITWYSLPVAGKVATLGQKLDKVNQGYVFTDTLTFAIAKADADKWTKISTIINPENKWIYVLQCGNGFYWTGGYRHGGRITAYRFDIGARDGDNGYNLTISCQSENKLLTNLDENYVINYIL